MQTEITQEGNRKTFIEYSNGSLVQTNVKNTITSIVQNFTGKTFLSGVTQLTIDQTVNTTKDSVDITLVAGQNLLSNKIVTTNSNGQVVYATASNLNHLNRIVGLTTHASTFGDEVVVRKTGVLVNTGWNFTPNQLLYLGLDGDIVTNPNVGAFSNYIGYALTTNTILINIGRSIVRG